MPAGKEENRLKHIEKSLKATIDELTALYEVSKSITSAANLDRMLKLVVMKVAKIMKANVCMIHLTNESDLRLKTSHGIRRNAFELKLPLPINHSVIGQVSRTKKPVRMENMGSHPKNVFYNVAKREGLRSLLVVPLVEKGRMIGVLSVLSNKRALYTRQDEKDLTLFANQAAVAIENARLFEETKINYLNTMKLLASVIDAKDTYTEDHSERVMRSALAIADYLKLNDRQKSVIRYASLLHDIGKIGIDMTVLRKPSPLTKDEWLEMRKHPRIGADIIRKAGFLDDLVPAILYHHVNYAGGGYPNTNKRKNKIPIEARVLAVADAYEAMVTDRPYRKHMSSREAASELKKCSGVQFDPKVVNAFLKYLSEQ